MTTVATIPHSDVYLSVSNDAAGVVEGQIAAMTRAGNDAVNAASSAISNIASGLENLTPMEIATLAMPSFNLDTEISTDFAPVISNPLESALWKERISPDATYEPTPLVPVDVPLFTAEEPSVTIPAQSFQPPGDAPEYTNTEQPVQLPDAPVIDINQILATIKGMIGTGQTNVSTPQYTPVSFDGISTGLNLQDPLAAYTQRLFTFTEPLTDTELTSYLLADIALSLSSGGVGLTSDVENAIYQRAKDRITDAYVTEYNRSEAQLAASGWVIPTGAEIAMLSQITAQHLRATEQLNYEVMLQNAQLVLQDRANARDIATKFEQVYRDYLGGYYARMLEAQKQIVTENVALFGIVVEHNKLLLAELETRVELYKAFLTASFAELDAFSKQLDMYKVQAEIRGQDAQLISTWVNAALASVQVYEAQIQGAIAVLQSNKIGVEVYGEKVRAHVAKVQAYATEVSAWSAEIDAATKQVDVYAAKAQAYAATAMAVDSANKTKIAVAELDLKRADFSLEKFKAQLSERLGELQILSDCSKIEATIAGTKGDLEVAKMGVKSSVLNTQAQIAKSAADINLSQAALAQETNKASAANQLAQAQLKVEALKSAATTTAQLAAGLLSAVNVGATISNGYSVGKDIRYSYDESLSNSLNETISS